MFSFYSREENRYEEIIGDIRYRYKKILIIGCPGAGKTHIGNKLSADLSIPTKSIDDLYWKKGWIRPKKDVFLADLDKFMAQSTWILDGNYFHILPMRVAHADCVIYLNPPTYISVIRFLSRSIKRFFGDLSVPENVGVRKYRISLRIVFFLKKVLLFKYIYHRKIINLLNDSNIRYYII